MALELASKPTPEWVFEHPLGFVIGLQPKAELRGESVLFDGGITTDRHIPRIKFMTAMLRSNVPHLCFTIFDNPWRMKLTPWGWPLHPAAHQPDRISVWINMKRAMVGAFALACSMGRGHDGGAHPLSARSDGRGGIAGQAERVEAAFEQAYNHGWTLPTQWALEAAIEGYDWLISEALVIAAAVAALPRCVGCISQASATSARR